MWWLTQVNPAFSHLTLRVGFSVNCYSTLYSPIWIQFGEVHLDPCAVDYTFDYDCFKLTLHFGINYNPFWPLQGLYLPGSIIDDGLCESPCITNKDVENSSVWEASFHSQDFLLEGRCRVPETLTFWCLQSHPVNRHTLLHQQTLLHGPTSSCKPQNCQRASCLSLLSQVKFICIAHFIW